MEVSRIAAQNNDATGRKRIDHRRELIIPADVEHAGHDGVVTVLWVSVRN